MQNSNDSIATDDEAGALTIPELKAADRDYDEGPITRVERLRDGYSLTQSNGWTCWLADEYNAASVEPKVGQTLRVYGLIGRPFYGMDLDGVQIYWLTPKEREAKRAADLAKIDRDRREQYEKDRDKNNEIVANLPEPLRRRIERFRAAKPNDERLWEGYEIFCCEQAAWLADMLRPKLATMTPAEAVEQFRKLDCKEQEALGMSGDHSGNTFGGMCMLARAVLEGKDV